MSETNIVDSHNKVLSMWAALRSTLKRPPRLITLDHHTDTSRPFRRFIANTYGKDLSESQFYNIQNSHLETIDFNQPSTVIDAISKLSNDEHIITAIQSNIISSAYVVAHNAANTNLQTYKDHKIICRTVSEITTNKGLLRPDYNKVLESPFLDQALKAFDDLLIQVQEAPLLSEPYILDIDLDYFNTFQSIEPKDAKTIKFLAKNAALITIATEPEYVQNCAVDNGITSEYLLRKVKKLFSQL